MKPKKIVSLGDVHLFIGKNFHVHQHVFNKFYAQLDLLKPDLIVVTGDIVDSKIKLSPEQIDLCRNFFLNLSSYCPLIVILGNHDAQLTNKDRSDSLSPILHSIYNESTHPIHFLKETGVYNLYDNDWAVWSCLDGNKAPEINKNGNYVIGLFHGAVKDCSSDTGFLLDGVDIEEFKHTDIVMMSDIHRAQSFRNNEMVYSGSFLQTKVSENESGTYLLWTWNNEYNKYIPEHKTITNVFSTINHELNEIGAFDTLHDKVFSDEQLISLRYDTSIINKSEVVRIKKELESKYPNKVEIRPLVRKKARYGSIEGVEVVTEYNKLNLEEYFGRYLEKNHSKLELKEGDHDKLHELDKSYSINLDISKDYELGDFSCLKLVLNNFLSYPTKETVIDFSKPGIYSIAGKNTSGKSSILHAIKFCLFNLAPGNINSLRKLINKNNKNKECYVELFIIKSGRYFKIKRSILSKTKSGVAIDLDFFETDQDGNEVKSLKGEKRQDTEKEIEKYFGIDKYFDILSISSALKNHTEFINCKNSERLTLVNRFLGLQAFEEKEKEVYNDLKTKKTVYQELLKGFDDSIHLTDLENKQSNIISEIEVDKETVVEITNIIQDLISDNKELVEQYNRTKVISEKKVSSPDDIKKAIDELERKSNKLITDKEAGVKYIEVLKEELELQKQEFFEKTSDDIKTFKVDHRINKTDQDKLAVNNSEIAKYKKQLGIDTCNNCGKDFSDKDKAGVKLKINGLQEENGELSKKIEEVEKRLEGLTELQNKYNTVGRKISTTQTEVLELQNKIDAASREMEKHQFKNDEYLEVEEAKALLKILKINYEDYNKKKSDQESKKLSQLLSLKTKEESLKTLEKEIKTWKEKYANIQKIEEDVRLLTAYKTIIHKKGLPLYILKTKMDLINEEINLIVNQVFDYNVEFVVDDEAGDMDIDFYYEADEERTDSGLASGSETFIMNLCIKVGLSRVSELPKIDSLFVDEGFGTLDKVMIEKMPPFFLALNEYYRNVITISHLDELKDMANHQIILEKDGEYTNVIVT